MKHDLGHMTNVHTSTLAAVLVVVAAFLFLAITISPGLIVYDEGLVLTGAMRVAAGQFPHKDFYADYGPGQFYVLAGLFRLFGQSVLIERIYGIFVWSAIVSGAFCISLRLMTVRAAVAVAALCALWISSVQYPTYPNWPTLLLTFIAVLILIPVFDGLQTGRRLFLAGLCVGGVTIFRYDAGMLVLFLLSVPLLAFGLLAGGPSSGPIVRAFKLLAPFWAGAAIVFAAILVLYFQFGLLGDFFFQLNFWREHYVELRGLPLAPPVLIHSHGIGFRSRFEPMILYMPALTLVSYLALEAARYRSEGRSSDDGGRRWLALLVAGLAAGFFVKGLVRPAPAQMAPAILTSLILLGYVTERTWSLRQAGPARVLMAALIAASLIFALVPTLSMSLIVLRDVKWNVSPVAHPPQVLEALCGQKQDFPRARNFACLTVAKGWIETARYIDANTAPDQTIFVGNETNDMTYGNDNALYFVTGRMPATKWSLFNPGIQNSESIQLEMVHELQANKPPLVVLEAGWDHADEPNGGAEHSGVKVLDNYISEHYEDAANFDTFAIKRRSVD